jgi:hypothetical protein
VVDILKVDHSAAKLGSSAVKIKEAIRNLEAVMPPPTRMKL